MFKNMFSKCTFLFAVVLSAIEVFAQDPDSKAFQQLNKKERENALKINLLSPFYGTVNLAWQHKISNDASFQLTATYMDFDSYGSLEDNAPSSSQNTYGLTNIRSNYTTVESQVTRGTTITPEYRFVLNGRGFSGIYIAPFARYMYYEYRRDVTTQIDTGSYGYYPNYNTTIRSFTFKNSELYTYHSLGLGVIAGKQFVFKNRVLVDIFGGPVYSILLASNRSINRTGDVVIGSGIPNTYIRGYGIRAGFSVGFLF